MLIGHRSDSTSLVTGCEGASDTCAPPVVSVALRTATRSVIRPRLRPAAAEEIVEGDVVELKRFVHPGTVSRFVAAWVAGQLWTPPRIYAI